MDDLKAALGGGGDERRPLLRVGELAVRTAVQEELDGVVLPLAAGEVERRLPKIGLLSLVAMVGIWTDVEPDVALLFQTFAVCIGSVGAVAIVFVPKAMIGLDTKFDSSQSGTATGTSTSTSAGNTSVASAEGSEELERLNAEVADLKAQLKAAQGTA